MEAQFSTVLNVPPDTPPSRNIGSNTQLNLYAGGSLSNNYRFGAHNGSETNIELNIFGGSMGYGNSLNSGTTVNMSGGQVEQFRVNGAEAIMLSGGSIDELWIENNTSTNIDVSGGTINDISYFFANSADQPSISAAVLFMHEKGSEILRMVSRPPLGSIYPAAHSLRAQ